MGRAPCCDKASVKKGPWSPEEDRKLRDYIHKHGTAGNWIALPQKAGLKRCGKSCRLRWLNYLRPNIKHGDFSDDEDRVICSLVATIGSRWSIIAAQLPGRTDNDIKNYWNTKLKKKLMGLQQLQASTHRSSHSQQQQQQQHLFFPAATPPLLGLGDAGTSAAAAAHDIHLFSQSLHHHQVHHLAGAAAAAAAAPHHYSSTGYSSCSAPQLATAVFGIGGDQQQMPTSSSCFDLCNGSGVGLESFIFGGFDTMTGGGATLLPDEHHQYMSSSCDHEMKPFLVVPSGSTASASASASSLLYGEAAGTALLQAKGDYYLN